MGLRTKLNAARTLLAGLLLGTVGCGGADNPEGAAPWRVAHQSVEGVSIGLIDGPEEYVLGEVASVAADVRGHIYVADALANLVRVYDPDGQYVGQAGRGGEGPGEYFRPRELAFSVDGTLFVESAYMVQSFAPRAPDGIAEVYQEGRIKWGTAFDDHRRGRVDRVGRYMRPVRSLRSSGDVVGSYGVHAGLQPDSVPIPVPAFEGMRRLGVARYMISENTGAMVMGMAAAPFEPIPSWTITHDATIIGGPGDAGILHETDAAGDTLRTIRLDRPRRATPPGEGEDSAAALRLRIDSIPVPLAQVEHASPLALSGALPDSLPAYIGVYVAEPSGNLWIEVWPEQADTRLFDVLSPAGRYVESVEIPSAVAKSPAPFFTDDAVYGVVRDPATDVARVVRVDVVRSSEAG